LDGVYCRIVFVWHGWRCRCLFHLRF
jgi:hypothetical protein